MSRTQVLPDSQAGLVDGGLPAFACSRTDGGDGASWVHLAGALGVETVLQLLRTLRQPAFQARLVVLDLRDLARIDSFGVHAIVNASIRERQAGRRMVLLRGPPNVDRMFTLTGRSDEVEIGDLEPGELPAQVLPLLARPSSLPSSCGVPMHTSRRALPTQSPLT